jgi:hypothetical protein
VTLFILLAVPALTGILGNKVRKRAFPIKREKRLIFGAIPLVGLCYMGYSVGLVGETYLSHTAISKPLHCPHPESLAESYVYSDGYFYSSAAYVICGPFNFLTDATGPFFKAKNSESKFAYLDPKSLGLTRIQDKFMTFDVQAPCNIACMKEFGIQ